MQILILSTLTNLNEHIVQNKHDKECRKSRFLLAATYTTHEQFFHNVSKHGAVAAVDSHSRGNDIVQDTFEH